VLGLHVAVARPVAHLPTGLSSRTARSQFSSVSFLVAIVSPQKGAPLSGFTRGARVVISSGERAGRVGFPRDGIQARISAPRRSGSYRVSELIG
jgi:hypothetical protein